MTNSISGSPTPASQINLRKDDPKPTAAASTSQQAVSTTPQLPKSSTYNTHNLGMAATSATSFFNSVGSRLSKLMSKSSTDKQEVKDEAQGHIPAQKDVASENPGPVEDDRGSESSFDTVLTPTSSKDGEAHEQDVVGEQKPHGATTLDKGDLPNYEDVPTEREDAAAGSQVSGESKVQMSPIADYSKTVAENRPNTGGMIAEHLGDLSDDSKGEIKEGFDKIVDSFASKIKEGKVEADSGAMKDLMSGFAKEMEGVLQKGMKLSDKSKQHIQQVISASQPEVGDSETGNSKLEQEQSKNTKEMEGMMQQQMRFRLVQMRMDFMQAFNDAMTSFGKKCADALKLQ